MAERNTQGIPARTGAPRHRAKRRLRAALSIAATTGAAAAAAIVAPLVVTVAPASAAAPEQCVAGAVWGGIATLTGRDTNTSLYAGGDLTVSGPASETEGLTVVGGDLDTTATSRAFLFGKVGMGSGQWTNPDGDVLAVGGDTRTNPVATPPWVTGNGRVGGSAVGPALQTGFAEVPDPAIAYGVGAAALAAVSPGAGGAPVDFSAFGDRVTALSGVLAATPATGTTTIADAAPGDVTMTSPAGEVSTIHVEDAGMVTFTGDGTSSLQVFTLDGTALTAFAADRSGISFDFEGIPAGTSVVVNVTGGTVAFAQGWRTVFDGADVQDAVANPTGYATAASSVLFNYAEADSVTISGGAGTETSRVDANGAALTPVGAVSHNAAAQSIGSIISPRADVTVEVTTNGRLLTGGDVHLVEVGAIALDLEHHNFAWSGARATACLGAGSVSWTKTDAITAAPIGGSGWRLTGPGGLDIAVVDNGANDADGASGALTVTGLDDGDYTLTESAAPTGYALDPAPHTFTVAAGAMAVQLGAIANTRIPEVVTTPGTGGGTDGGTGGGSGTGDGTPAVAAGGMTTQVLAHTGSSSGLVAGAAACAAIVLLAGGATLLLLRRRRPSRG
jgi:choice-of-anchor A domain-containing protein